MEKRPESLENRHLDESSGLHSRAEKYIPSLFQLLLRVCSTVASSYFVGLPVGGKEREDESHVFFWVDHCSWLSP